MNIIKLYLTPTQYIWITESEYKIYQKFNKEWSEIEYKLWTN